MKKHFGLAILMLLLVSTTTAQSQKELKAAAKQKELVASTTTEDGSRYFYVKKGDLEFKIRNCTKQESKVTVSILVCNNSNYDSYFTVYGNDGGVHYQFPTAIDNFGKDAYYLGESSYQFANASNGTYSYKDKLEKVFVPANGATRLSFEIGSVDPKATSFSYLEFTFTSSRTGPLEVKAKVYDLIFDEN